MDGIRGKNGFTLLELIFVIVVIGILSAVAISRYINLTRNASDGAAKGVLGALRSQNTLIYSQRIVGGTAGRYTNNNTMRYVALSMLRIPTTMGYGFSWTAGASTFRMTVGGIGYTFTLSPYPDVPTTMGRITAGGGTFATW